MSAALVATNAPSDILTGFQRKAALEGQPSGLSASRMNDKQKKTLWSLIAEYICNMPDEVAEEAEKEIRSAGLDKISFAWAGPVERGEKHYYRVQGPTFLLEYDNTQGNGNHIHSVWRDFEGDFGMDLLAAHYKESH